MATTALLPALLATPTALDAALGPALFLAVLLGLDLVTDYWP